MGNKLKIKSKSRINSSQSWKLIVAVLPWLAWYKRKKIKLSLIGLQQFVATNKKKVKGVALVSPFVFGSAKFIWVHVLSVKAKTQGQGIGSQLLKKITPKKKGDTIALISAPWRKSAHKFYTKKGFKKVLNFFFYKQIK